MRGARRLRELELHAHPAPASSSTPHREGIVSDFTDAIERCGLHSLHGFSVGACPGCATSGLSDEPTEEERCLADEAHFSLRRCPGCGSTFGGDRHPAHYLDSDNEINHTEVCTDCLYLAANGDEPEEWSQHP
jgi:hypothetical protein